MHSFKVSNLINSLINNDENKDKSIVSELSGGEKKKILLSMIFSTESEVIILDEPFAELDSEAKNVLIHYINSCSKDRIIIIITHEIPKELDNEEIIKINMSDNDNVVTV
ncbi:ATP-binding cassette domain-containing protein [Sedimentibacter sp. zth1]|uniref:ATP-binding cassette domain-containing protein n=1 Tax=Sedimentibacter sp. zth1 TaxID=2816908 RepID=UPI001A9256DC|nr:ABC transporter ATP-binding protein [Sedimentibacter sp. zth1]QSX05716.1 ATP-binding cassette domain-containing protein [Sedimentibacter sp. zth1]